MAFEGSNMRGSAISNDPSKKTTYQIIKLAEVHSFVTKYNYWIFWISL